MVWCGVVWWVQVIFLNWSGLAASGEREDRTVRRARAAVQVM